MAYHRRRMGFRRLILLISVRGIPHCDTRLLQPKQGAAGPPESLGKSAAGISPAGAPRGRTIPGQVETRFRPYSRPGQSPPFPQAPPRHPRGARPAPKRHRQLIRAVYCGWLGCNWRGWRLYLQLLKHPHLKFSPSSTFCASMDALLRTLVCSLTRVV